MRKPQHSISSKLFTVLLIFLALPITIFLVQYTRGVQGAASSLRYTIYENALASGWKARMWASRINLANTSPIYSGSRSISFTPTGAGARLYLYTNTPIDITSYSFLHFAARASRAGQDYNVILYNGTNHPLSTVHLAHYGGDPVPGTWKVYTIPLSDLGANATHIKGIAIQNRTYRHGALYLDSMSLTGSVSSQDPPPTGTSTQGTPSAAVPSTSPSGTSPSGQAIPTGDIPGWHQVFADDFNGTTLNTSNWGDAYSGQPGGDPAGWWDPSHVVVSGGLLTLKGYKDAAAKSGVFVTGGISMKGTHAQTYGKYLVRMRVDKGNGIAAIALLWPQANVWPPEVDFYEDSGDGNRTKTQATLHCGPNGNDACQVHNSLSGYDFSQWHTLGVEWTVGKLVYTIDGTAWATVTDSRVPSIPMVLDLQTQSFECSQNTCLNSSTPAEVDMQVAWVVAYAPA